MASTPVATETLFPEAAMPGPPAPGSGVALTTLTSALLHSPAHQRTSVLKSNGQN